MNEQDNDVVQPTIPGVKVAMPSSAPVDATSGDVGAANSVGISALNNQQVSVNPTTNISVVNNTDVSSTNTVSDVNNVSGTNVVSNDKNAVISNVDSSVNAPTKKQKKKNGGIKFLLFLILVLIGGIAFLWRYHESQMLVMKEKCTPVSTSGESKKLDLKSTIVKDLYSKVYTTIREDVGQSELNDELKLYLAFRQIPNNAFYDSNCNLFVSAGIEPFVCEESSSFRPKAFKVDTLQLEVKKLFGDDVNIANQNIQLGNSCMGGYEYIAERGEYVEGFCKSSAVTMFRADKKLISATSTENTIVLRENVKYYGSEGVLLPERLVSGIYEYTFKLDVNYNYIYMSKTLVVE